MTKISITRVPQADELSKVIATVEAVFKNYNSDAKIAEYVGFTDRQGRYYRLAAEILGLLQNNNNYAFLTELGKEFIVLDDNNRMRRIRNVIATNEVFKNILTFIEQNKDGLSRNEVLDFLIENIEGAESTINRRFNTILNWLTFTSLIKLDLRETADGEKETVYKLNDQIDESDFLEPSNFADSIYPAKYSDEELDIKESHMQVVGLVRKKDQGKILVPEFQRNQVWKQQQKSRFIESLILNIPIPAFYVSQDIDGNLIIVDGLQRSSAVFGFLNGEYPLVGLEALPNLNNLYYQNLDKDVRTRIEDRDLLLYILKPSVPMAIVYDIFNRINSNGTPLTRQEIRNCIYIGKATRLLASLSENEVFRRAIDDGIPALRMKDREAILRFFAFSIFDYDNEYDSNLDDFLGKAMRKLNRLSDNEIEEWSARFIRAMQKAISFFGDKSFRLPTEDSRGRINVALFETTSIFFDTHDDAYLINNRDKIIANYYNGLLKDPKFVESIKTSTNSRENVKTRFEKVSEFLTNFDL